MATPPRPTRRRILRGPALIAVLILVGMWVFLLFGDGTARGERLTYSEFQTKVDAGEVATATFLEGEQVISGELQDGTEYVASYPLAVQETLTEELQQQGVQVDADPQKGSPLGNLVFQLFPVLLIVGRSCGS